jgi:hypothetical protein
MSDTKVTQQSNSFSPALISAIAKINAELSLLSNKEVKEALTMIGSIRNLRIVSMDRPIGLTSGPTPRQTSIDVRARASQPKRAAWRTNPQWTAMEKLHRDLVDRVKAASCSIDKDSALTLLRKHESAMKLQKQQLLGFHEAA